MTVVCDIQQCPYYDRGFCCKAILKITNQGVCKYIMNPNRTQNVPIESKEPINMITLAKKEE